jgi:hypothetical protein
MLVIDDNKRVPHAYHFSGVYAASYFLGNAYVKSVDTLQFGKCDVITHLCTEFYMPDSKD